MPCSSPKHAPLHLRGLLLGLHVCFGQNISFKECWAQSHRTKDMQQNKLLLWSERGIWLGLSHVHLPRRHLIGSRESNRLPKNWWGFEGCPIRVVARHTLSGSKYDVKGETPGGSGCLCVCTCWMCVRFKGLLVGANSKTQTRAGTGMGVSLCPCMHKVQQKRNLEASRSSEGHAQSTKFLSEPKQSCFTQRDRQYTDNEHTVNSWITRKGQVYLFGSA